MKNLCYYKCGDIMKKTVSVLLVAIMLCTFSFCAFAVDNTASVNIVETVSNELRFILDLSITVTRYAAAV